MLYGLAAVVTWAAYSAYARAGVNAGLAPFDFVFLRFVTAALIILPWLVRHRPTMLGPVGWGKGLVLALFAGPVFIAFGGCGCVYVPLVHGAVIQPSVITLAATLFAWVVLRETLSANRPRARSRARSSGPAPSSRRSVSRPRWGSSSAGGEARHRRRRLSATRVRR